PIFSTRFKTRASWFTGRITNGPKVPDRKMLDRANNSSRVSISYRLLFVDVVEASIGAEEISPSMLPMYLLKNNQGYTDSLPFSGGKKTEETHKKNFPSVLKMLQGFSKSIHSLVFSTVASEIES